MVEVTAIYNMQDQGRICTSTTLYFSKVKNNFIISVLGPPKKIILQLKVWHTKYFRSNPHIF